jgi:hypothetical protein
MFIDKNWYDNLELYEFYLNETDILNEVASAQTRIKLARAARRKAARRAYLTKLRAPKRKQLPQLKKRAYNEVKTAFRKKLYKGNWKNLSYSSRARIDAALSKRKVAMGRMVKRIMPAVVRGEGKRLQRLRQNKRNK